MAVLLHVNVTCHCGREDHAEGPNALSIGATLLARGWALVWTGGAIVVWGCSDECKRRLLPARRFVLEKSCKWEAVGVE